MRVAIVSTGFDLLARERESRRVAGARTMVMNVCSSRLCQNQCDHEPSGAIMPG